MTVFLRTTGKHTATELMKKVISSQQFPLPKLSLVFALSYSHTIRHQYKITGL